MKVNLHLAPIAVSISLVILVVVGYPQLYQFKCEKEGNFRYPYDCSHFYQCVIDRDDNSTFTEFFLRCPADSYYNPDTEVTT